MRALILCLMVAASALSAHAQTAAPSREALSLAAKAAHAAQPHLDDGVGVMVRSLAGNYREGTTRAGGMVDEKALAEVSKSEIEAFAPLLWDGLSRIYAELFSLDELKALISYYKAHPGDPSALPAPLAAKSPELQSRQQALVGELGPRVLQDFFGDYCSRAACSDVTRQAAGLPVHAR